MRVQVHWNVHRRCFSVVALEGPDKGRVVAHRRAVCVRDAEFVVQPAGHRRYLRTGRRNVHAFVRGRLGRATRKEIRGMAGEVWYLSRSGEFRGRWPGVSWTHPKVHLANQVYLDVVNGSPRVRVP